MRPVTSLILLLALALWLIAASAADAQYKSSVTVTGGHNYHNSFFRNQVVFVPTNSAFLGSYGYSSFAPSYGYAPSYAAPLALAPSCNAYGAPVVTAPVYAPSYVPSYGYGQAFNPFFSRTIVIRR